MQTSAPQSDGVEVVVVASSAGGIDALVGLLGGLCADLPVPVLVVRHPDPRHRTVIADVLGRRTPLTVRLAEVLTRTMILNPAGEPELHGGTDPRALVHQAAGMVSVELDCPMSDARELIKARAFTEGVCAYVVADRIVRGELRLA